MVKALKVKVKLLLITIILSTLICNSCFFLKKLDVKKKESKENEEKLVIKEEIYSTLEEPQSIINNYSGMVEDELIDWVWLRPDTHFGRYKTVTVVPFKNLSFAQSSKMEDFLTTKFSSLLQDSGVTLTKEGEIIIEGAIVEVIPKDTFLERIGKILPGDFEDPVYTVAVELIIGERVSNNLLCKIRHQVSSPELKDALREIAEDLVHYLNKYW